MEKHHNYTDFYEGSNKSDSSLDIVTSLCSLSAGVIHCYHGNVDHLSSD